MSIKVTVMSLDFESNQPPTTTTFEKDELVVGRDSSSDLVLVSPEISTDHAKISIKNDGGTPRIYVTDLGSSNGTLIESKPLSPNVAIPMATHERIVIGNYLIKPEISKDEPKIEAKTEETEEIKVEAKEEKKEELLNGHSAPSKVTEEVKVEEEKTVVVEEIADSPFATETVVTSKSISGVLSDDSVMEITIEARELLTLSGRATRKGEPLVGVRIDAGSLGLHVTDTNGKFVFKNVPEDTSYKITASKDGYIFDEASIEGTLRSNEEFSLEAKKLLTLKGKVIHKGVPLSGVTIDGGALGTTTTAPDGSYAFKDVPEGTAYNIVAKKDGYTFNS